jgi:hypothetical protein
MTVKESLPKVVTPANAGVQTLIWDEVRCCSNYDTVSKRPFPQNKNPRNRFNGFGDTVFYPPKRQPYIREGKIPDSAGQVF